MINGSDFIRLAGKLCVLSNSDEAAYRTAVSRAYYGAFHLADEFLENLGFPVPRNENAHGFLRLQLMGCGHALAAAAGSILRELHRMRVRADYDLTDDRFRAAELARVNVENAHKMRTLLDQCTDEPTRSEVEAAIAAYHARLSE
jgi:hypothetical protein